MEVDQPREAPASQDGVDRIQQAWLCERPGTPVDSIGIITRIWRIAKLLDDDRRHTMARLGIDAPTRDLLSTLRRAGPPYRLTPSEIARSTLVSAGAISQRLTRAESQGLIRRRRDRPDGRNVTVELTPKGHAVIERTVEDLLCHEETLLTGLTPARRDQLASLLRILLADLTARTGEEDRPPRHNQWTRKSPMARTAIVTGGGTGIGRAIARRLVSDGMDVIVTGRRKDVLEAAANELGGRAVVFEATDPDAIQAALTELPDRVDVLVNNAGGNIARQRSAVHRAAAGAVRPCRHESRSCPPVFRIAPIIGTFRGTPYGIS
jgi:DNA-binding MarR family transcriptional regulator